MLAAVASSCTGGSSAASHNHTAPTQTTPTQTSSTPPADHGGYLGHGAKVFDAAYRTCYRSLAKGYGVLPKGTNNPALTILIQPNHRLIVAAEFGCNAGMQPGARHTAIEWRRSK
jgi:hypothetical protein